MKTILTPIDFSRVTPWVVAESADLARRLSAHLILLNVSKPNARQDNQAAFLKTMQTLVERRPKRVAGRGPGGYSSLSAAEPVSGDSIQLIGEPVLTILDQAKKMSAEFIVMGSHGRSALHDLVFGSVAAGVLKHAPCPVIVVPSRRATVGRKKTKVRLFSTSRERPNTVQRTRVKRIPHRVQRRATVQ